MRAAFSAGLALSAELPKGELWGGRSRAFGKVIHISEAQSKLCAAYGLPAGSIYSVVMVEMLELQDPRKARYFRTLERCPVRVKWEERELSGQVSK